jgi:hypothetical protein
MRDAVDRQLKVAVCWIRKTWIAVKNFNVGGKLNNIKK